MNYYVFRETNFNALANLGHRLSPSNLWEHFPFNFDLFGLAYPKRFLFVTSFYE